MDQKPKESLKPLVVDLDGTLIKTDILYEGLLKLIKKNFLYLFLLPFWMLKGKYNFKEEIFSRVDINPELLPYNEKLIEFLKEQKNLGREIILATASLKKSADKVANHIDLFSRVYGSENGINLKSKKKRDLLVELFGEKQFDYAGNSKSDIVIFKSCDLPVVVNSNYSIIHKAKKINQSSKIFKTPNKFIHFVKAIRVYQWIKNSLVFVPLITSQNWYYIHKIKMSLLTIFCFSIIASAGYLLNDLLDLESDRRHLRKRKRPIAAGNVSISLAIITLFFCILVGFGISAYFSIPTFLSLLFYFILTTSYSLVLKRFVLVDIFTLAILYTLRIIAGGVATDIPLSFWLLAFSVFIFFSLAVMKRSAEIIAKGEKSDENKIFGRGYFTDDLSFLNQIGISSGYIGIIVFALYINSSDVIKLYHSPQFLWLACLLLMFWINYLWYSTHRSKMTDDPIIFSITDKVSLLSLIMIIITIVISV